MRYLINGTGITGQEGRIYDCSPPANISKFGFSRDVFFYLRARFHNYDLTNHNFICCQPRSSKIQISNTESRRMTIINTIFLSREACTIFCYIVHAINASHNHVEKLPCQCDQLNYLIIWSCHLGISRISFAWGCNASLQNLEGKIIISPFFYDLTLRNDTVCSYICKIPTTGT